MEYIFNNINEAFPVMWHMMWDKNAPVIEEPSRNGPVRRSIFPVTTIFLEPRKRVLFDKVRDCNPFFHFFESIWMLAGRNEVAWLVKFNKRMQEYSDDGVTLVSSYGYRWSKVLTSIINRLQNDKSTRRAYIPIFWMNDCFRDGKDIPCNTGISFYVRDGQLDMTVFNRSNDMLYGAYGANVVHFSFLQEYIATAIGCEIGYYAQISSNFHIYTEFDVTKKLIGKVQPMPPDPYNEIGIDPSHIMVLPKADMISQWQRDAKFFIDQYTMGGPEVDDWHTPFFARIAVPMYRAWHAFVHEKDPEKAGSWAMQIAAPDWQEAALQWFDNRIEARNAKANQT